MKKEAVLKETRDVVQFIKGLKYNHLPADVIKTAKYLIMDNIGCMLAGLSVTDHAQIVLEVVKALQGKPEATIIGDGFKTNVINAAMSNGTNAHSLDMDDTHRECFFHVGVTSIPSVLALAERDSRNGKDIITAVVAAYEVAIRLGMAVNPSLKLNGYHVTGTCGTFAGAVGAGKMLDLNEEQLVNALGLAGTQAAGLFQFIDDGDMSKRLHAGKAASNGVLSALLAQKGYSGPYRVLEGRYGFPAVFAKEYDSRIMSEGLGENFRIREMGIKLHASCRMTHSPIDAALMLAEQYDLNPDDVQKGEIRMGKVPADQLKKQDVKTFLDGQLSGPFSVALAICNRKAGYQDFMKGINDRKVLDLTNRIHMVEEQSLGLTERTAIVNITTKDGQVHSQKVKLPRGEPEIPFSDEEVSGKFRDMASTCLGERKIDNALDILTDLENMGDCSALIGQLVP